MPKGTLEVIAGPMFAGKTSALLKKARSFDGEMILIKPSFDTRYGICEIKTHDGVAAEAFNLTNTSEILESDAVEKAQAVFLMKSSFYGTLFRRRRYRLYQHADEQRAECRLLRTGHELERRTV